MRFKGNSLVQFLTFNESVTLYSLLYKDCVVNSHSEMILQDTKMEGERSTEKHKLLMLMLDTKEMNTSKEYAECECYKLEGLCMKQ